MNFIRQPSWRYPVWCPLSRDGRVAFVPNVIHNLWLSSNDLYGGYGMTEHSVGSFETMCVFLNWILLCSGNLCAHIQLQSLCIQSWSWEPLNLNGKTMNERGKPTYWVCWRIRPLRDLTVLRKKIVFGVWFQSEIGVGIKIALIWKIILRQCSVTTTIGNNSSYPQTQSLLYSYSIFYILVCFAFLFQYLQPKLPSSKALSFK